MKPLKVALVVKGSPSTRHREDRNMGWWSYAVPEFTWEHFVLGKPYACDVGKQFAGFDLVFHEDGGNWGEYKNKTIPVVYLSFDSTVTEDHYAERLEQGKQADLILLDHDRAERFAPAGVPVRPFPYCVNDRVYYPRQKDIDISFHCAGSGRANSPGGPERAELRSYLGELAKEHGWSYKSGMVGLDEYSDDMGRSKVIVNWPRTVINRPHRVFDAMASRSCLVTGPLPDVEGDYRRKDTHYIEFARKEELPKILTTLLSGKWADIALNGYELVRTRHTWRMRALQLRLMLKEVFGL